MSSKEKETLSVQEQLATARELKAKREADAADRKLRMELDVENLKQKFSAEGEEGPDWRVIVTPEGPIVLKLGDSQLFKSFGASKLDDEAVFHFVVQQVAHPDRATFASMAMKRAGVVTRCQDHLLAMHRGQEVVEAGK